LDDLHACKPDGENNDGMKMNQLQLPAEGDKGEVYNKEKG
jgi:hypothetical protein